MIEEILKAKLADAVTSLELDVDTVTLEYPAELSHGDFATNLALVAAKKKGVSPKELAEKIKAELGEIEGVENIEVAGPGFLNFTLRREYFAATLPLIDSEWGKNPSLKDKRVVVEYAQPNPFKPFHIGHLMSTTVGETLSRFVEWSGANLFRANYQGDIGPHVAKCIWGLLKQGGDPTNISNLSDAYVFGNAAYEDSPESKAEINAINKKLYEGDSEYKEIYDAGKKVTLDKFEEIYALLGTRFDAYFFESETGPVGMTMVEEGLSKGIFEKSDGAIVYLGEKKGLHTRVFVTSQGTPTYETKELGLAKRKYEKFPYDLNITTVAVEQDGYFTVVEEALAELWPEMKGVYTHKAFGMMVLSTGKMASRKGNIISGETLLLEMKEKALEKMKEREFSSEEEREAVANAVAVAAIKFSILKQARGKNITFNPEQSLSFEGDSGPYLQYSHARACSILEKSKTTKDAGSDVPSDCSSVERLLPRFPHIVERALNEFEPHHVTTYLTELSSAFNSWYAQEKIVGSEYETHYIGIVKAFTQTMKNGLWLLGIEAPEKM